MSGHSKLPRAGALQILGALLLLLLTVDARAMTAAPSPSFDGNYTVSWSTPLGCTYNDDPPFYSYQCYSLLENGVEIGASGYSLQVTGRPAGSYQYVIYYALYVYGNPYDAYVVEGPANVTVGTPPARDPIPTQLTYQYQTRAGDINYDGRVDLLVERTSGGVPGNGVLDKVVLWQNPSGSFSPVVDSYYTSVASAWPPSSATPVVQDINVDGYVDVAVKGVPAVTGTAYDQIIFSSGAPLIEQPLALRAVDAPLTQFAGNALDYAFNTNYFYWNANYIYIYGYYYYLYCSFYPYYYGAIESYYYGGWGCGIYYSYFSGYYVDYSEFSEEAVSIWTNEAATEAGTLSDAQSTENVQQAAEAVLGVPIGGGPLDEFFGPEGQHGEPDVDRGRETFWAIVWLAKIFPGAVWTEEAPPQQAPVMDTIYVTGHKVFGKKFGPIHTALQWQLYPGWASIDTISAGPGPVPLVGPYLNKKEQGEGEIDEIGNMLLGTVSGTTWALLAGGDNAYANNDLFYFAFPFGNTYNSNSYVSGLIEAKGGAANIDLNQFVGGGHLVPANKF